MSTAIPSIRDGLRQRLADLKMPGALEAVDAILASVDGGHIGTIEAIGQLQYHEQVMVVYAEEPLPDDYRCFATHCVPLGLALLLGRPDDGDAPHFSLKSSHTLPSNTQPQQGTLPLLHWLVAGEGELLTGGERFAWHWVQHKT